MIIARENLTIAFEGCHKNSTKNKKLILKKLIPLNMLQVNKHVFQRYICDMTISIFFQGVMPSKNLLKKYDLEIFKDLTDYIKIGDVRKFRESIDVNEVYYMKCGVYLLLQKLINLVYRNLFKKL